jgi:hypothetical protein
MGVAGQGAFHAAREISFRVLKDDIDLFGG